MSVPRLRQRLRDGELVLAAEAVSASPGSIELLAGLSFDALVIDARHAAVSAYSAELERLVRAAEARQAAAVVRVGQNTPGTINRVMNDGAQGLIVAAADAASAAHAARSLRYPPDGFRGAAPVVRAAHFGLVPWDDYRSATNADRPMIISIETQAGLEAIDEIAAVEGVDLVLFDVFNLGLALGEPPSPDGQPFASIIDRLTVGGCRVGVTLSQPEGAERWRDAGCTFIVVGNDVTAYAAATRELRASLDVVPTRLAGGGK